MPSPNCFSPAWLFAPVSLTRSRVSKPPPCFSRTILYSGASLPSTGSARAAFPGVVSTMKALRHPVPNTGSLIVGIEMQRAQHKGKAWLFRRFRGMCPFSHHPSPRFHKPPMSSRTVGFPESGGQQQPVPGGPSPTSRGLNARSYTPLGYRVIPPARRPVRGSPHPGSESRRCFL